MDIEQVQLQLNWSLSQICSIQRNSYKLSSQSQILKFKYNDIYQNKQYNWPQSILQQTLEHNYSKINDKRSDTYQNSDIQTSKNYKKKKINKNVRFHTKKLKRNKKSSFLSTKLTKSQFLLTKSQLLSTKSPFIQQKSARRKQLDKKHKTFKLLYEDKQKQTTGKKHDLNISNASVTKNTSKYVSRIKIKKQTINISKCELLKNPTPSSSRLNKSVQRPTTIIKQKSRTIIRQKSDTLMRQKGELVNKSSQKSIQNQISQQKSSQYIQKQRRQKGKSKSIPKSRLKQKSGYKQKSRYKQKSGQKQKTTINQQKKTNPKNTYVLQQSNKLKKMYEKFYIQVLNEVPGRRYQAEKIYQIIINSENGTPYPICLHGNTGCGKTSLITKMISFIIKEFPKKFSTAYLNCMSMWSVNHVYSGILFKLFGLKQKKSQRALNDLFQFSQSRAYHTKLQTKDVCKQADKTKIIVLDQIDHFIKDKTFIYNLLQWCHIKNSKIILIMISNILDLSVNLSSKIQSRMKFQSLVFKPYSHQAIQQIVHYKYEHAKVLFQPKAISFMCRKVASINSDIRLLEKIYGDVIDKWKQTNGIVCQQYDDDQINQFDSRNQHGKQQHKHSIFYQSRQDHQHNQQNHQSYKQNNQFKQQNDQFKEYNKYNRHKQSIQYDESKQTTKKKTLKIISQKQVTQKLLQISKRQKITISQVQKSLFLTGQLSNSELPQILRQYQIILKVLHKATKKQQVSYEIMNKTFLKRKKMPSSQEIFLLMCQLKDMGLIEITQNTKNCHVLFNGFGIKINQQLHLVCPQQ